MYKIKKLYRGEARNPRYLGTTHLSTERPSVQWSNINQVYKNNYHNRPLYLNSYNVMIYL